MANPAKKDKTFKGLQFKVYVYGTQQKLEKQEGTITHTDEHFTDTGHVKHFDFFDEIPRKMRQLMKEANRKPSAKKTSN